MNKLFGWNFMAISNGQIQLFVEVNPSGTKCGNKEMRVAPECIRISLAIVD